jgi:hypothetical protein
MSIKSIAEKYGLLIDEEHFEGLVFVYSRGSEKIPGYCKIYTKIEFESNPNIELEFAEMAIKSLWTDNN